ncbi:endonuclease/exonuclease/phosphatase family protein [Nocardiopsis sp. EMB25]|uniref:endonuclease/exonuclease/phosphatase family protein n=1 Tax=Nocardiopsis sp. EMB25 TaxID=2835867 RepID=UPI002284A422|nr:endonuclease/exonuclease/phosphatase family protein [Nocardiopsis sp. EMB25]MCY9785329.1 endonuclease/exonuclease/phosphatase family protein [Nocardiopsis sp. EMB25]
MTVVVWAAVTAFALFALVRAFGWERGYPLVPLMAFTPYVLVVGAAAELVVGLLRRWVPLAVLATAVLVLAVSVLPRAVDFGVSSSGDTTVRLLTLNVLGGGVAAADVVELVRDREVDVLALQEVTPEMVDGLEAAGLDTALPYAVDHSAPGPYGSSVHSAFPLTDRGDPGREVGGFHMAHVSFEVPEYVEKEARYGSRPPPVEVVSVHPVPPHSAESLPLWRAGLASLPDNDAEALRILAGDFNATLDHAPMRAVLDSGYADAARVHGEGLTGTWPADGPLPRVAIDHVLVDTMIGVRAFEVLDVDGSDHRGVLTELTLPSWR